MSTGDSPAIRAALGTAAHDAEPGSTVRVSTQPPCPLPGCGAPLYLIRSQCVPIEAGSTPHLLSAPISSDWRVECENSHVVLLPPDDGTDHHIFGHCPGATHDEPVAVGDCACTDAARLAALGPSQAAPRDSYLGVYRDDKKGPPGRVEDEHGNDLPGALAAFTAAVTDPACKYATLEYLDNTKPQESRT